MNREDIYAALFALVWDGNTFLNPEDQARTLKHWTDVPANQLPAMFMAQGRQTVGQTPANGLPPKWTLEARLYIYVGTRGATSPGAALNPILDVLTAKLNAGPTGPQRLGGLVEWARIEGTIETSEGTLGDLEVAIVPVSMLFA